MKKDLYSIFDLMIKQESYHRFINTHLYPFYVNVKDRQESIIEDLIDSICGHFDSFTSQANDSNQLQHDILKHYDVAIVDSLGLDEDVKNNFNKFMRQLIFESFNQKMLG